MSNLQAKRKVRILDFDIENRPLSYWVPDRPTAEVTAVAWSWSDSKDFDTVMLGRDDIVDGLRRFAQAYSEADMVTGHYIRKHDLPILQGEMMEKGLPPLGAKLTCDTKLDMLRKGDMPATQEHLSEMLGVRAVKYHMTQAMWREANRLTREGIRLTENRVVMDVQQHKLLRLAMLNAGLLGSPKMWRP